MSPAPDTGPRAPKYKSAVRPLGFYRAQVFGQIAHTCEHRAIFSTFKMFSPFPPPFLEFLPLLVT